MLTEPLLSRQSINDFSSGESIELSKSSEDELLTHQQVNFMEDHEYQRDRVPTQELLLQVYKVNNFVKESSANHIIKSNFLKRLVSKNKCRYELDGFDLDLTYVTSNVIAMGYPASDFESVYRNSIKDVQRFFDSRHPRRYKIYNLCSERKYPLDSFNGQIEEFPFCDHQAPPFRLLFEFCENVLVWLKSDRNNVVGIHCKAGKGRTGVMICAYLLYSQFLETSRDVQRYYSLIRTNNRKGITIPSQIRYVKYFEQALKAGISNINLSEPDILIKGIKLSFIPNFRTLGGCDPWFRIQNRNFEYISQNIGVQKGGGNLQFFPEQVIVQGDVLIQFFNNSFNDSSEKMFQFWFNTAFESSPIILIKAQLDQACKVQMNLILEDKQNKKFLHEFNIELSFIPPDQIRQRSNLITSKEHYQMIQKQLQDWRSFQVKSTVLSSESPQNCEKTEQQIPPHE